MHPTHNPTPHTDTTASTGASLSDILRGAALYLHRHGWHQGAYYPHHDDTPFPPACAVGAIRMAVCGRPVRFIDDLTTAEQRLVRAVNAIVAAYLDGQHNPGTDDTDGLDAINVISCWNDEDWRTRREVIDLLTDAADDHDWATTGDAR